MRNVLIIMLLLVSCGTSTVREETKPVTPPPVPEVVVKPKEGESELDALKRERKEAKATIAQLKSKVTNLDSQIQTTESDNVKWYAKLIGSIAVGLGAICLVASFFTLGYPILPTLLRYSSYVLGSVGFLAFVYSALYGYFLLIGIGMALILVGTGIYLWFHDRRTLKQVVGVVETHKEEIVNYKDKFRAKIDKKADKWLNKVRGK